MGQIFDGIINDGIYATFLKAMVVKASTQQSEVLVQPGRAWFDHTWTYIDADFPVAAPAPEVILDRVDTLVLDINQDNAARENKLLWVTGTPSSVNPEAPQLTNTATHHQYPLCDVYRKAGTTMIYQEDITNRVGTSDTPFVTGVLEHINIDDLLSQWDSEFHTWENGTKVEFETWMASQESVYTAWWDSLKNQMAGDVADVEAWVQTIKNIIDSQTATHLQLEIDELNEWVPNGSYITVTTEESDLFSRAVTISDPEGNSDTVNFSSSGVAVFKSFPYVGVLTIESTTGAKTATTAIDVPYFSRYETDISFWEAEINLNGDPQLAGTVVTVKDSNGTIIGTVTLDQNGHGDYLATRPDTYKFVYTVGGTTMEISLAVTEETTYNVELYVSNVWKGWVTAGGLDPTDYESLTELLADEKAIRRLNLVHASVDYFCSTMYIDNDLEYVVNNDIFAKWVNLSDYALDNMSTVTEIKTLMDAAGKYGYGEWCLMPQVPVMTSNTAPYGTVTVSSKYSDNHDGYRAFDGNKTISSSSPWLPSGNVANNYICYTFPSPQIVKKVYAFMRSSADASKIQPERTFKIQGSNDSLTWADLGEFTFAEHNSIVTEDKYIAINNNVAYTSYRIFCAESIHSTNNWAIQFYEIQFYTYAPKGLVPKMTSNTTPWGEASSSGNRTTSLPYMVFDRDESHNDWQAPDNSMLNSWIQYRFKVPTKVTAMSIFNYVNSNDALGFELKGSMDGSNWSSLLMASSADEKKVHFFDVDPANQGYYIYYRLVPTAVNATNRIAIEGMQFYGRQLKDLVPSLVANNKPYGLASCVNGTTTAWKSFIGSWLDTKMNSTAGQWVQYQFKKPVNVLYFMHVNTGCGSSGATITQILRTSSDGTNFSNASAAYTSTHNANYNTRYMEVTDGLNKQYFRVQATAFSVNSGMYNVAGIYFYGYDYSEKEFEENTTVKYLYDHGVELEQFTYNTNNSECEAFNNGEYITVSIPAATQKCATALVTADLTNYSVLNSESDLEWVTTYQVWVVNTLTPTYTSAATASALINANNYLPSRADLNVNALTGQYAVGIFEGNNNGSSACKGTIKELWLE